MPRRAAEVFKDRSPRGLCAATLSSLSLMATPGLRMTSLACRISHPKRWNQRFPILENVVLLITLGGLHFDIRTLADPLIFMFFIPHHNQLSNTTFLFPFFGSFPYFPLYLSSDTIAK
jgi:hypothetical protein